MEKDNDVKQQLIDRINKKRKVLTGVGVTGAIAAALSVPLTIGVGVSIIANDIQAEIEKDKLIASVRGTAAYEIFVDETQQKIKDAFYNGEISYAEFKSQYESVGGIDTIKEFADAADNEVIQRQIVVADEYAQTAEDSLTYGLTSCLLLGAAGGATFGIADAIDKKYKNDLRKLGVEEKELAD